MRTFRWIVFIPAAIAASVLAGVMGTVASKMASSPVWITWFVSGGMSGAALMITGLRVAPRANAVVKWALIILLLSLGLLSGLGSLLGQEPIRVMTGVAMVLVGLACIKTSPSELSGETHSAQLGDGGS